MILVDAAAGSSRATGVLTTGDKLLPASVPTAPASCSQSALRIGWCARCTRTGTAPVRVLVDEKMAYQWQGPIQSAPLPELEAPCRTMFIGSQDGAFTLSTMKLSPLPPPTGSLAGTSSPAPPTPPTVPTTMPTRRTPPDAATLAAELEKARAIYEDELKKATKPDQKAAVGAKHRQGRPADGQ